VFGDAEAADADAVVEVWEAQKRREKADRTSVLDGVPMAMPSLLLAEKLVGRAERAGLEVRPGVAVPDDEDALGDALLDTVIASAAKGLDAERALRSALRRFTARIREVEAQPAPEA
jgi:XTP/dITP diphosphohydrolase